MFTSAKFAEGCMHRELAHETDADAEEREKAMMQELSIPARGTRVVRQTEVLSLKGGGRVLMVHGVRLTIGEKGGSSKHRHPMGLVARPR